MISDYRCFYCFTRAFEKLLKSQSLTTEQKNNFTKQMAQMYTEQQNSFSAPEFARQLHALLRSYTNNADPYKQEKKDSNDLALQLYTNLKKQLIEDGCNFDTAIRLAIAGNIIDYAVGHKIDLPKTIDHVLSSNFAINHSEQLKTDLQKAKTVLYIGDNAGEIVFDKLFIENIMHPNIFYAVRGVPIINDATIDDALYVGIDNVADVISNGYDAPSTILKHCSDEFKAVFNNADVIISKGQGNFEGLFGKTNKNIYFLLMVKCGVIADALNVDTGSFVVTKNPVMNFYQNQ